MDELFYPRANESRPDWHARLAALDPVTLTCHQRQRHKVWLEIARDAARKKRRARPRRKGT
jgi:hypothetical protein